MEELIQEEVIRYQEKYIEELEQQVELLKRTILKQKKDIQTLIKKNRDEKYKNIDKANLPLGFCPYQE